MPVNYGYLRGSLPKDYASKAETQYQQDLTARLQKQAGKFSDPYSGIQSYQRQIAAAGTAGQEARLPIDIELDIANYQKDLAKAFPERRTTALDIQEQARKFQETAGAQGQRDRELALSLFRRQGRRNNGVPINSSNASSPTANSFWGNI